MATKTTTSDEFEYKCAVIGGGGVGKSSLTICLVTGNFMNDYDPTIEDSYKKRMKLIENGKNVSFVLDVLDTAGREEFSTWNPLVAKYCESFLLVYSITSRVTFEEIEMLHDKILTERDEKKAMVIVGNKCDLQSQRQVSREEGEQFAKKCGLPFYETSAKDKINNQECFLSSCKRDS